jgi:hypothetical protein
VIVLTCPDAGDCGGVEAPCRTAAAITPAASSARDGMTWL